MGPDAGTGPLDATGDPAVRPSETNVGARLDDHHSPETNGRMAVCRRCGSRTDGPEGLHHVPGDRQLSSSSDWLDAQARQSSIERLRGPVRH